MRQSSSGFRAGRQYLSIAELVARALQPLAVRMANRRIVTEIDIPADLQVMAEPGPLTEALRQLIDQSIRRLPRGGQITITALENDRQTLIEIADDGPDVLPQRSAAGDAAGPSYSMGVVHRALQLHGGTLEVMNCPEGGAAYTLCLPRGVWRAAA